MWTDHQQAEVALINRNRYLLLIEILAAFRTLLTPIGTLGLEGFPPAAPKDLATFDIPKLVCRRLQKKGRKIMPMRELLQFHKKRIRWIGNRRVKISHRMVINVIYNRRIKISLRRSRRNLVPSQCNLVNTRQKTILFFFLN